MKTKTLGIILLLLMIACNSKNDNNHLSYYIPIKDTISVPNDSNQLYFPLHTFEDVSSPRIYDNTIIFGNDTIIYDWKIFTNEYSFSRYLFAMREPILSIGKAPKETYRFTWLRTFHNPVTIGIEHRGSNYSLYWKILSGLSGYSPIGKLIINKHKEIDEESWNNFQKLIDELNFWEMSAVCSNNQIGFDGASWILEGRNFVQYHAVYRHSPDSETQYYKCCKYLIELAEIDEGKVYK